LDKNKCFYTNNSININDIINILPSALFFEVGGGIVNNVSRDDGGSRDEENAGKIGAVL
jgi:hypothetical protein